MPDDKVRLDSWLWAARFFKTRTLAKQAIEGGKVHMSGQRAKPGKTVTAGDRVEIHKDSRVFVVNVLDVASKRGPASQAEQLYRETEESRAERERLSALRRTEAQSRPRPAGRPDKRERRALRRMKGE
jgi:ribosome-associated heat shock protein Hsp15